MDDVPVTCERATLETHEAYLQRLGLQSRLPSAAALKEIVTRHVEVIPYETLWIAQSEQLSIDSAASAERLARSARGAYCFQLNGALGWLLSELGYDVRRHLGAVHQNPEPLPDEEIGNHLVLTVHGLVSEEAPSGEWYVDVGLGTTTYAPLPLRQGVYRQGPNELELRRLDPARPIEGTRAPFGDWRLQIRGILSPHALVTWSQEPADKARLAERNAWLSRSPDSGFVQVPTVQRRELDSIHVLRGQELTLVCPDGQGTYLRSSRQLSERSQWFQQVEEIFGLSIGALGGQGPTDAIWAAVENAAAQRQALESA